MIFARHHNLCLGPAKSARFALTVIGLWGASCLALLGLGGWALAQEARTNRMQIEYVPPKDPAFQPIYDALKQNHTLEKLQQIFSPFRLPMDMTIKTTQCGMSNAWYQRPDFDNLLRIPGRYSQEPAPGGSAIWRHSDRCHFGAVLLRGVP